MEPPSGVSTKKGEALFTVGRPEEGRRALLAAFELYRPRHSGLPPAEVALIALRLAADAARRGDLDDAERWAARGFEVSTTQGEIADALLLDPATRALTARPIGQRIRELGRDLHGAN